jgi:nucleoside-diphosphate-sugar epimerase
MDSLRCRSSASSLTSHASISSSDSYSDTGRKNSGKILVITGGSGWLGSTIAKLAYTHWGRDLKEIRLFDIAPPQKHTISSITGFSSPSEGKPKVSYHPGSILEEGDLLACFTKADVVIHCAGLVENGSLLLRRKMKTVNVGGTQKVVQACLECGVRALVFTGSIAQILQVGTTRPVQYDENSQPTKQLIFAHYGGSKNEAENLVLLADGKEGREGVPLRTCSLRIPPMYGEGDRSMVLPVVKAAKQCFGYALPVGLDRNSASGVTMSSLYVGNGAWAHIVAARKLLDLGEPDRLDTLETTSDLGVEVGGKFFYIGDHSPCCSMSNFLDQFFQPMGYRFLPFGIPFCLLKIFVFFYEFLLVLLVFLNIDVPSRVNRTSLNFMQLSHSFSWDKAKRELGYTPLFSHQTALAESVDYYRTASS